MERDREIDGQQLQKVDATEGRKQKIEDKNRARSTKAEGGRKRRVTAERILSIGYLQKRMNKTPSREERFFIHTSRTVTSDTLSEKTQTVLCSFFFFFLQVYFSLTKDT